MLYWLGGVAGQRADGTSVPRFAPDPTRALRLSGRRRLFTVITLQHCLHLFKAHASAVAGLWIVQRPHIQRPREFFQVDAMMRYPIRSQHVVESVGNGTTKATELWVALVVVVVCLESVTQTVERQIRLAQCLPRSITLQKVGFVLCVGSEGFSPEILGGIRNAKGNVVNVLLFQKDLSREEKTNPTREKKEFAFRRVVQVVQVLLLRGAFYRKHAIDRVN